MEYKMKPKKKINKSAMIAIRISPELKKKLKGLDVSTMVREFLEAVVK
jgi:hypothetical protein